MYGCPSPLKVAALSGVLLGALAACGGPDVRHVPDAARSGCPDAEVGVPAPLLTVDAPRLTFETPAVPYLTLAGKVHRVDRLDSLRWRLFLENEQGLAAWGGHPARTSDTFSVVINAKRSADARLLPTASEGDLVVVELARSIPDGLATGLLIADSLGVRYAYDDGAVGNALSHSSLMPLHVTVGASACSDSLWSFPYLRFGGMLSGKQILEGQRDTLYWEGGWGGWYGKGSEHVIVEALTSRRFLGQPCTDCPGAYYSYVIRRWENRL
jgi:hypothetical protein